MKVLIVGAGMSGLSLGHALLDAGIDVTIASGRSSTDLRQGRAQLTQLTLAPGLAVESDLNLSLYTGTAPHFTSTSLQVISGPGEHVGFCGAMPGESFAVDPRVKLADWYEMFEDLGGRTVTHGMTVTDLEAFSTMYDIVALAVGDGKLGQVLDTDPSHPMGGQRVVTQAYIHHEPDEDFDRQLRVFSCPAGEVFVVPTQLQGGWAHSVMLIARPGSVLDCSSGTVRRPQQLWDLMRERLRLAHINIDPDLDRAELTDEFAVRIKSVHPTTRIPVQRLNSGRLVVGLGDTVMHVPPQNGQGCEASVRSGRSYADMIIDLARSGRAVTDGFLSSLFPAYLDHAGGREINAFDSYVDRFWQGQLAPHEQQLFQRACADQSVADDYVAGFADPARLAAMLTAPA
mgnify:CR=1 FL=1